MRFPENPEAERLVGIIWDLRRKLFWRERFHRAQERVYETVEEEARRRKLNEKNLRKWDEETEAIIRGTKEVGG